MAIVQNTNSNGSMMYTETWDQSSGYTRKDPSGAVLEQRALTADEMLMVVAYDKKPLTVEDRIKALETRVAATPVVYEGTGSVTLSSLLGLGATKTVTVTLNGAPPLGYIPQITVWGATAAYVTTYTTRPSSVDVVIAASGTLSVGTVINVNVQAV